MSFWSKAKGARNIQKLNINIDDQIIIYSYVNEFIFYLNSLSFQTELTLKLITNEIWKSKW